MINFIVFGVVAVISIAGLLGLSLRNRINNAFSWSGSLLILLSAILALTGPSKSLMLASNIVFGVGAILFIIGIFAVADRFARKGTNRTAEVQARTVSDILEVAASRESLIELLNYSLDRFLEVFSLNSGAIHIYHQAKNKLVMGAYRGLIPSHAKRLELLEPGQTAIGRAVQNKRVLIIRDLSVSPDFRFFGGRGEGYSFLAVAPILVDDNCWGVISFLGRRKYHRGIFTIDQLEQFGYKLGQALELGRENRRMAAAYGRLNNIIDLYNRMFGKLKAASASSHFDDAIIFQALQESPSRLFDGKTYALIQLGRATGRCVYRQGNDQSGEPWVADKSEEIPAERLLAQSAKGQYFVINDSELAGFAPRAFFKNKLLVGYGYTFADDFSGIVIIDDSDLENTHRYNSDLLLIGNLFTVSYLKHRLGKLSLAKGENGSGNMLEVAQDLSTIFAGISGNIQLIMDQFRQEGGTVKADAYLQRLDNLEKAAMHGIGMLSRLGLERDPNNMIQEILSEHNLNVAFYPGSRLPVIKSNLDDFKTTLDAILTEAISDNKMIRLKTSPENDAIALTIEGAIKPGFPSEEIINRARNNDIILNIIKGEQGEVEESTGPDYGSAENERNPRVLTVENKAVITDLLEDFFERIGYENTVVVSGREGLAYVKSAEVRGDRPDIAVIDMALDDIPGLELCREIKKMDDSIYTVIISSWGVNLHSSTLDDAGVDAVLHKPFRLEQLKNVLPKRELKDAAEDR